MDMSIIFFPFLRPTDGFKLYQSYIKTKEDLTFEILPILDNPGLRTI